MIVFSLIIISTSILYNQDGSNYTYANSHDQGEVTASSLNVREKASTSSIIVGSLKKGNKVTIENNSGKWYKISYHNVKGFVHSSYVKTTASSGGSSSSSGGETLTSTTGTGETTASNLNVRASASTNSKIVSSLSRGTKVNLYGKSGSWYKVKIGNNFGYVHGSYMKTTMSSGVSGSSSGGETSASATGTGEITASNLNVRASASTSSKIISSLSRGTKVDLYKKSGSWYKVKIGSNYGYVHSSYVKITTSGGGSNSSSGGETSTSTFGTGEITVNNLNVRASASTSSKIISSLSRGTKVDLYKKSGSWYKVKIGSNYGYVHSSYVKITTSTGGSNSSSGGETSTSRFGTGEITASNLNVRASASTSSKIISSLGRGTKVVLYEKSGEWFKIKLGNSDAYIHGSYVKTSTSSAGNGSNGSLSGKTIFLDPGHGGNDPGAVATGNIYEKTIVLSVSNKLKNALEQEGAKVVTSRTNDTYISLSNRVNQANQSGADAFISLHANSWHDSGPNGIEVLYNRSYAGDESARLSQVIQTRLANGLNLRNRGAREMSLQVIRSTRMPSVLVELGFMSNSSDLNKLRNNQDQYVNQLVTALKEYY